MVGADADNIQILRDPKTDLVMLVADTPFLAVERVPGTSWTKLRNSGHVGEAGDLIQPAIELPTVLICGIRFAHLSTLCSNWLPGTTPKRTLARFFEFGADDDGFVSLLIAGRDDENIDVDQIQTTTSYQQASGLLRKAYKRLWIPAGIVHAAIQLSATDYQPAVRQDPGSTADSFKVAFLSLFGR